MDGMKSRMDKRRMQYKTEKLQPHSSFPPLYLLPASLHIQIVRRKGRRIRRMTRDSSPLHPSINNTACTELTTLVSFIVDTCSFFFFFFFLFFFFFQNFFKKLKKNFFLTFKILFFKFFFFIF